MLAMGSSGVWLPALRRMRLSARRRHTDDPVLQRGDDSSPTNKPILAHPLVAAASEIALGGAPTFVCAPRAAMELEAVRARGEGARRSRREAEGSLVARLGLSSPGAPYDPQKASKASNRSPRLLSDIMVHCVTQRTTPRVDMEDMQQPALAVGAVHAVQRQPCEGATGLRELDAAAAAAAVAEHGHGRGGGLVVGGGDRATTVAAAAAGRRATGLGPLQRALLADALGVLARDGRPVDGVLLGLHEAVGPHDAEAPAVALDGDGGHAELLRGLALGHMEVLGHLLGGEVEDDAALAGLLGGAGRGLRARLGGARGGRGQVRRRRCGRGRRRVGVGLTTSATKCDGVTQAPCTEEVC
ncbi:hypothetical protein ON010_g6587 [Phytophthora cinnamomi]|nr:hypothetical protein ON010_g6587 [Phytophthora cinnamomi]